MALTLLYMLDSYVLQVSSKAQIWDYITSYCGMNENGKNNTKMKKLSQSL